MYKLTVERGESVGMVYLLKAGENTLGRSRSATCKLQAGDVSGVHAKIVVEGGVARLENLSQYGTRLDDAAVKDAVELKLGQRIMVGKSTVLLVGEADASDEAPTGDGHGASAAETQAAGGDSTLVPTMASAGAAAKASAAEQPLTMSGGTRAATGAGMDDFSELTRAMADLAPGDDEEGMTRAMQTRAATPEELEHLMALEQKRARQRYIVGVAVVLPLLLLFLIFRPRTPPPELEIEWSRDVNGRYSDNFIAAPSGGFKEGGFDICYPDNNTFEKRVIEGGLMLEGQMGRKLDVPMRVIVEEAHQTRFVELTRAQAVEDWMREVADKGTWNFDPPSPTPAFYGRRNGIAYARVTYTRDSKGSWFGVASLTLDGDRRIVARAEVPAVERVRAEKMLNVKLINPANEFESAHWEGSVGGARLDEQESLRQIRAELERIAPATWVAIEKQLKNLLTQATLGGRSEVRESATQLLTKLRERQALWFNSQQLAFDAAIMQNDWLKAAKVAEFTKAVFTDVEDQRYFDVRKWKAEP